MDEMKTLQKILNLIEKILKAILKYIWDLTFGFRPSRRYRFVRKVRK